jgi:hypothetical protein
MGKIVDNWLLRKSMLQQILLLFFLYLFIGIPVMWLFDLFLLQETKAFGYYVLDAAILSLILTITFRGKAIKALILKSE